MNELMATSFLDEMEKIAVAGFDFQGRDQQSITESNPGPEVQERKERPRYKPGVKVKEANMAARAVQGLRSSQQGAAAQRAARFAGSTVRRTAQKSRPGVFSAKGSPLSLMHRLAPKMSTARVSPTPAVAAGPPKPSMDFMGFKL